jgi:diadenosine tetraphosphate (Ap4A) HIT family hydrolase
VTGLTSPAIVAHLPSGLVVMGDTQHLPGYCILLSNVDGARHLSDLPLADRVAFLTDMALVGEAVLLACRSMDPQFRRINYEILGNTMPELHAHIHARYEWEPAERVGWPVWRYPDEERRAAEHAYGPQHEPLRDAIAAELARLRLASG